MSSPTRSLSPRSLTQVLPGELLVAILTEILDTFAAETNNLVYAEQLRNLSCVDRRLRKALFLFLSKNFRGISIAQSKFAVESGILAWPWLPSPRSGQDYAYWAHANGQDWGDVVPLALALGWLRTIPAHQRNLAIDIRIQSVEHSARPRLGALSNACRVLHAYQATQWVLGTTILNHLAHVGLPGLESIYIRLSPQQQQIDMALQFIGEHTQLRCIIIEVDSLMDTPPGSHPVLDLGKLTISGQQYAPLERLIVRAPRSRLLGWDDPPFVRRLEHAVEVRLSVLLATFGMQPHEDFLAFLRSVSAATDLEFGVVFPQPRDDSSVDVTPSVSSESTVVPPPEPVHCPRLVDLTVQLPDVDARLLALVHAPNLRALRVRCTGGLDAHGDVPANHFPQLRHFRSACSTTVQKRAQAIGLVDGKLITPQSGPFKVGEHGDFTIHIKPDVDKWADIPDLSPSPCFLGEFATNWVSKSRPVWQTFTFPTSALFLSPDSQARRESLIKARRKARMCVENNARDGPAHRRPGITSGGQLADSADGPVAGPSRRQGSSSPCQDVRKRARHMPH